MSKTDTKGPVISIVHTYPENHGALGRRIELGAKSHISKNKPGAKYEYMLPTIEIVIGIGKDHIARLVMDEPAWKALNKGAKLNITTIKEFTAKFL